MKKDKEWFYCGDCNQYIKGREKAISDHLEFGHIIKRRTPLEQRIVHTSNGKQTHVFNVDGND